MAVTVRFAVYGALRDGDSDKTEAADVTAALQAAINKTAGEVVRIDNQTLGPDPAEGVRKHFGAIVDVNGRTRAFACEEDQTIDFT